MVTGLVDIITQLAEQQGETTASGSENVMACLSSRSPARRCAPSQGGPHRRSDECALVRCLRTNSK